HFHGLRFASITAAGQDRQQCDDGGESADAGEDPALPPAAHPGESVAQQALRVAEGLDQLVVTLKAVFWTERQQAVHQASRAWRKTQAAVLQLDRLALDDFQL